MRVSRKKRAGKEDQDRPRPQSIQTLLNVRSFSGDKTCVCDVYPQRTQGYYGVRFNRVALYKATSNQRPQPQNETKRNKNCLRLFFEK